jgi:hypothetical protein
MDTWLTDRMKELLFSPCLEAAAHIGRRLDSRRVMGQSIDERALTEDFVDLFDSSTPASTWGRVARELREDGLYLNTSVRKSTREAKTGADIGLIIDRRIQKRGSSSRARYAALVQCKKVDGDGWVTDFYHTVASSQRTQSSLMLDITASSFYFVFVPPSLIDVLTNLEPIAFAISGEGCSSPVWNMGYFEFSSSTSLPLLSGGQKAAAAGILVLPALAIEAQGATTKRVALREILANCLPFWYWFGELLIPGFVGDYSKRALSVASNVADRRPEARAEAEEFGVRYSINIGVGSG